MTVRLGTRSSLLARWQSESVAERLREHGATCEIVLIETRGDDITDRPLPEIGGQGAFTERIERELRASRIDIAVHSLKDLPIQDAPDLCVGAVLARQDVRDVLVSRGGLRLADLPAGAVVGSSSTRREAQLRAARPDIVVKPIRGNVETRIRKVRSGEFDATVLAAAGVLRLGLADEISEWLDVDAFLPAPGQGAIAVQCRRGDADVLRLLAAMDEPAVRAETEAERAFLQALGGGCSAPVGAWARRAGAGITMRGRVGSPDGTHIVDVEGEGDDPVALARELARRAMGQGAGALIRAAAERAAGPQLLRGLRVLVTRPRDRADELIRLLTDAGASAFVVPLISTRPLEDTRHLDAAIGALESYRWVVLASATAAGIFCRRLRELRPDFDWGEASPRVAAVGPSTAAVLARHGLPAAFLPTVHTGAALAAEMVAAGLDVGPGTRLLLPRAEDGREEAAETLRGSGARVDDVPVYRTGPRAPTADESALLDDGVDAVLFASGSAVEAWCAQVKAQPRWAEASRNAAVACIGPTTASAARQLGLRVDVEAETPTAAGLVAALGIYFARTRSVMV